MIAKYIHKITILKNYFSYHVCLYLVAIFFSLNLSAGCIVSNNKIILSEISELRSGETAFFQKDYEKATAIFLLLIEKSMDTDIRNTAQYNLACTKLLSSDNENELIEAIETLFNWTPSIKKNLYLENPKLIIQVLQKRTDSYKKDIDTLVKNHDKKIITMEKMIQTLQHQISELESIDQEIQKKRETN
ncbi:MAG: hypothetical protein GY707_04060 [Desulfobacteraceae bacterium]|nr:hypothetical protein [Desulfobacteraceae bacterium]